MNILSLFDGISCGRVALERAGIPVEKYFASEIELQPIQISKMNWPDIIQLGDVLAWDAWIKRLPKIDLLIGGSPCQDISMLGFQRGMKEGSGTRSSLFHTMKSIYFWLLKNNNPNCHILLENVFTKPQWEKAITDELRLSERMGYEYTPTKINSSLVSAQMRPRNYWCSWETTIPEDKHIYLQDILEHGYAYQLKSNALLKSYTDTSIIHSFKYKVNTLVAEKAEPDFLNHHNNKTTRSFNVKDGYIEIPVLNSRKNIGTREFEKYYFPVILSDGWYRLRSFTAREFERLQTLPDNYCKDVPLKWVSEATGNGWTVDVIAHLFRCLLNQYPEFINPLHI